MRTFAQRQRELQERRYASDQTLPDEDGTTVASAKLILTSRGGKAAAKLVLSALWKTANEYEGGYLPTAQISAPLRVLTALETVGLVERATDGGTMPLTAEEYEFGANGRGHAIRFRLTSKGVSFALK